MTDINPAGEFVIKYFQNHPEVLQPIWRVSLMLDANHPLEPMGVMMRCHAIDNPTLRPSLIYHTQWDAVAQQLIAVCKHIFPERSNTHPLFSNPIECILARKLVGQTQEEFASLMGVTTMTILNWEKGVHLPRECHRQLLQGLLKEEWRKRRERFLS